MKLFDTTLMMLMMEVSVLLVVVAISVFFIFRRKQNQEINALHVFIDQMEEQATFKNKPLDQLLTEVCGLDRHTVDATLSQINGSERALLQNIIQLLLQRELGLLNEIDKNLGSLSEPYCQLLGQMAKAMSASPNTRMDSGMKIINEQLVRQLDSALNTIDEITAEYTRVFSGNQTALELENSSKKMLQIYRQAESTIKQLMQPQGDAK